MAITKNLVVTLKNDTAKPKEKMFVYRDDVGIEMIIELKDFNYSIDVVENRNNIQKAYALFRTPSNKTYRYTNIKISNEKLVFTFSQDIVNVMQEIGEYELQFQLYDKENNRLTIPSYNFYVKEPLTIDGELVDTAVVDESRIVDFGEEQDYIFIITDGYIKTEWKTGDLITKERLNKVENALSVITDAVNSKAEISQLHNHENKEILDTISANKINEWDNKSNFGGDYNSLTNKPTIPTKVSDLPNDSGYLTEHQDISGKVDKVDGKSLISDSEIERLSTLKNYDDTDIKNSLNSKADKTELHSHSNKNVLDGISSTKVTEWDNKSTFSGNYNDLTNKPTIPTLNGYATEQYVNEEIKKIDVTEQLTDYAKKSELHSHSNKSVLDGITTNKITEWDNKSNFSGNYNDLTNKPTIPAKTSQLTNDSGFITTVPSEYVTETELNSKGYLTQHQDISHKVDKINGHSLVSDIEISRLATLENYDDTEVCESINEINMSLEESVKFEVVGEGTTVPPISGGSSYILPIATKTTLGGVKIGNNLSIDGNGVLSATTSDKVDKINGYSLVSDAEISRLATLENYDDTDIKNTLNSKADKTELHSHTNKTVLDNISSAKVTEWNNKSTFSGNYNDLTNKPAIPSLNGYATEQYVDEEIKKIDVTEQLTDYAKKSELHSHSNKTVLDNISSAKVTEWNNKSNFSGSYNDLTNKPTIPTKTSQLTNDSGYLTNHQDLSSYAKKTEVDNLASDIDNLSNYATPQMFGAKGDGITDDTNAINQAIEYVGNNGVVYIPEGKYLVSSSMDSNLDESKRYVAIGIYQKENLKLILSPKAYIKHSVLPLDEIVKYKTARYYPLGIISSSNITVDGGIFEGEADEHVELYKDNPDAFWWQKDGTYSRGHGYGICIRGSDHVTIKNTEVFNVFGDAYHISLSSKGKSNFITLENCVGHSSTRQGLSVTGGDNTVIRNCEFYNIIGNSPESGIDFEPDSVANINTNALVENCYIHDCNQHTVIGALANRGIKIKGCRLEGSVTNDGTATEKVEFIDCDIFDYRSSNPERNVVNNCRIGTIGIYESGDDFNDCYISPDIFADNPKFTITAIMSSITIGNSNYPTIKFNNCKFDFSNSMGYASNFIPFRGTQAGKFIFIDCEFDMATHKHDALKFDARDLIKVTDCEFRSVQSTYNKPFITLNCTNDIILQNNILNLKGITTYSSNPIVDVTGKNIILEHNKILSNSAFGTVPFNIKFSSVGEIYCLRNMADKWGSIGTFPSNPTKMIVSNNIISTSTSLADFTEEYKNKIDNVSDLIQDAGFITEIDAKNYTDKAIANINANGVQQHALFANRIEECTDTTKVYVFPDGYIYAYLATYNPGGTPLHKDVCAISTDTDGSIFNGIGHKLDHRLNSAGAVVEDTGCVVTGFIPITKGDKFYLYNITKSNSQNSICQYKADKTRYGNTYYWDILTYDSTHDCYVFDTSRSDIVIVNTTVYLRFSVGYTAGKTIFITKNEYARFTESGYTYGWGNTGHAFIPADYENRILALEEKIKNLNL